MILPKPYISFSAAKCWYENKPLYRSKYYTPGGVYASSPQLDYGKEVADLMELNPDHLTVAHIPRYEIRDVEFRVEISGVQVLAKPDSLSLIGTPKFFEYKTASKPWTQEEVDASYQLKLYSLCIKEKYGSVQDECTLFCMPTIMIDEIQEMKINGRPYKVAFQVPRMTGEVIAFPTVVTEMERFRARQWIVTAAHEISADYQNFKKNL